MTVALCSVETSPMDRHFGACSGQATTVRPSRSQGRRSKSLRTQRPHSEVQCAPPAFQPPRAVSCGPRSTYTSSRSRGPRGRSRDIRRGSGACTSYRAMISNGQVLANCAAEVFAEEEKIEAEPNMQAQHALKEEQEEDEDEEEYCDEAAAYIAGLLEEAVDDYSDEMVFEILHKHEAPRIFDVPEPPIPEEDESTIAEDEADELAKEATLAFSEAAMEVTKLAFDEAEFDFVNGAVQDYDDLYDCEEAVSVLSCAEYLEEDQMEEDASEAAEWAAQQIVHSLPEQAADRMANIRTMMQATLEAACDSGELADVLERVREERGKLQSLPSAFTLSPCTRPTLARKFQPRMEGAPVPEEPFPFDCLPPTTPVAKSFAPVLETPLANEQLCRQIASSTLQSLYAQASKSLAQQVQKVAPKPVVPKPQPKPSDDKACESAIMKARLAFMSAVNNGKLEKAVEEVVREKKQSSFGAACEKMRNALVGALEDGRLRNAIKEKKEQESLCEVRDKMRNVFVGALEDGRLEATLQQFKLEALVEQARKALVTAASSGELESAINEVSLGTQNVTPEVTAVAPRAPAAPSAPPGSPTRRRFTGARTVVAPAAAACTVHAPVPPQTPRTPKQPAGARPGVRRPGRASTLNSSAEEAPAEQAQQILPPAASAPFRRREDRPTSARRGGRPTALELDLGLTAGSISAEAPLTPRGAFSSAAVESLRLLSKQNAVGTKFTPLKPSTLNSASSLARTMGRERTAAY